MTKKKFQEESNIGEPESIDIPEEAVTEETPTEAKPKKEKKTKAPKVEKVPEEPKPMRVITKESVLLAIQELGGKANLSAVRRQLGHPSIPTSNLQDNNSWANWVIRNFARELVKEGALTEDSSKRISVYTVVEQEISA